MCSDVSLLIKGQMAQKSSQMAQKSSQMAQKSSQMAQKSSQMAQKSSQMAQKSSGGTLYKIAIGFRGIENFKHEIQCFVLFVINIKLTVSLPKPYLSTGNGFSKIL